MWVDETRPLLQGARLTMFELERLGIDATLIADSAAASLMAAGRGRRGDPRRRPYRRERRRREQGRYVLAGRAGASPRDPVLRRGADVDDRSRDSDGAAIRIEERDPDEVRAFGGRQVAPTGAAVRNPAFDVTPARLVTAIVTEVGVARRPYARSLPSHLRRAR